MQLSFTNDIILRASHQIELEIKCTRHQRYVMISFISLCNEVITMPFMGTGEFVILKTG